MTAATIEAGHASLVDAELADAREAERTAEAALGDAQLAAIRGGAPVPSKLIEAVEGARKRRIALEAAAGAVVRHAAQAAATAQAEARERRLAEVDKAIRELDAALVEIDAALVAFSASGSGKRARDAVAKLRALATDASETALTAQGWIVAESLHKLRSQGPALVDGLAIEALGWALKGDLKPGYLPTLARYMREQLMRDLKAQPESWPIVEG